MLDRPSAAAEKWGDSIVSTVGIVGSVGSQRLGARNVCSSLLADDNRQGR
jgi:hypothetical protein